MYEIEIDKEKQSTIHPNTFGKVYSVFLYFDLSFLLFGSKRLTSILLREISCIRLSYK